MEAVLKNLFSFAKDKNPPDEKARLKEDLKDLKLRLDAAKSRFEFAREDAEIEATIYEMESLSVQYRHLLRQAKALSISCDPLENY